MYLFLLCFSSACFCAIRNVLECRFRMHPSPSSSTVSLNKLAPAEPGTPTGSIHTLIQATQPSPRVRHPYHLTPCRTPVSKLFTPSFNLTIHSLTIVLFTIFLLHVPPSVPIYLSRYMFIYRSTYLFICLSISLSTVNSA